MQKKQITPPTWTHGYYRITNASINELVETWKKSLIADNCSTILAYNCSQPLKTGRLKYPDFVQLMDRYLPGDHLEKKDREGKDVAQDKKTKEDNYMGLFELPYPHPVIISAVAHLSFYGLTYVNAIDDYCDWVKFKLENPRWNVERPLDKIPDGEQKEAKYGMDYDGYVQYRARLYEQVRVEREVEFQRRPLDLPIRFHGMEQDRNVIPDRVEIKEFKIGAQVEEVD
jgi:hypothetical protein